MNFPSSQVQAADFSERCSSVSGPSDMSKLTTTASESLPPESVTESCPTPLSSAISKHSLVTGTPQAIREWLMSSRPDSPANPSPSPESEREPMTKGICGRRRQSALGLCTPDVFCLKTCPEVARTCPWLLETCADLGMKFQAPLSLGLMTLGHRTGGRGCGLLPTARKCDGEKGTRTPEGHAKERERRGNGVDLPTAISVLPTPQSVSSNPAAHGKTNGEYQLKINKMLSMLPTPRAEKHTPQSRADFTPNLAARIQMLPTPTKQDGENNGGPSQYERNTPPLNAVIGPNNGLKLQPAFVEWMMGWPIGWTDLKPLEMDKFRKWSEQHGNF